MEILVGIELKVLKFEINLMKIAVKIYEALFKQEQEEIQSLVLELTGLGCFSDRAEK